MTTKLTLTMPGNGVPGYLLDDIEKALHSHYAKQGNPAYKTWGRIWHIEIETIESESMIETNHG